MGRSIGERIFTPDSKSSSFEQVLFQRHVFAYEETKALAQEQDILEIGCGSAYGTQILANVAKKVIAIDIDKDLIQNLSQNASGKNGSPIEYLNFDGTKFPFPNRHFSLVVFFQVIEHVPDDRIFLAEVKRILKTGGLALLTTPNRLTRLQKKQKPFNNFHYREYSPVDLKNLIEGVGFSCALKGVFGDANTHAFEKKRLEKYQTWIYRYLVQNLPRKVQMVLKAFVLKFSAGEGGPVFEGQPHYEFRQEGLDDCLDLWAELRPRA